MSLQAQPPLPPPPVQCVPAGWLGLLGIKSGGAQPGIVNPTLSPTIDMFSFYIAGARTKLSSSPIAAVFNGFAQLTTIPNGKVWFLETMYADGLLGVAGGVTAWFQIRTPDGAVRYSGLPQGPVAASTQIAVRSDRLWIALPGEQIGVFTTAAAAFTAFNWNFFIHGAEALA